MVWLRDPIKDFFATPKAGDFDVYFQDDGSRSTRFSPYFSNSGFYFLRQNARTRYFMTMLLYSGDQILEWRSHQSALVQVTRLAFYSRLQVPASAEFSPRPQFDIDPCGRVLKIWAQSENFELRGFPLWQGLSSPQAVHAAVASREGVAVRLPHVLDRKQSR